MPKSIKTLDGHVASIVENRVRTQSARFRPIPEGVERPVEVLRAAVEFLHGRFKDFRPSLSQLQLSRRSGELTHAIQIRAVPGNLSGVEIRRTVVAMVKSATLRAWTATEGTGYAREQLWVRQIGYLGGGREHWQWNLLDASSRHTEMDDMAARVERSVIPAFEAWRDKPSARSAVHRLTEVDRIDWLMETALWAGGPADAQAILATHLDRHPREGDHFRQELDACRARPGLPPECGCPVSGAAFWRHAMGCCEG